MEKMKQKFEKGKRFLTHRTDSCRFKPGDHIYAYRLIGSYSHHGIYVGDGLVIHFTPTAIKDSEQKQPCTECGYQHNVHLGVVKTCLNCFLSNHALSSHTLCVYQYDESKFAKKVKRRGTCSTSKTLPPETVVEKANELHKENGFGYYDLTENNCEDFATFCKTGIRRSEQAIVAKKIPVLDPVVNLLKKNKGQCPMDKATHMVGGTSDKFNEK